MIFNVVVHNRDDHAKNFAFRINEADEWELAPAYDLVYAEGPGGEHTMSVAGEGRAPRRRHFMRLAEEIEISASEVEDMCSQISGSVKLWEKRAHEAGIGARIALRIGKTLQKGIDSLDS